MARITLPRTVPLRRWLAGGALLAGAALAGGCSDSTLGPASVAGTYDLTLINGQSLPYTVVQSGVTTTYTDGLLTLNDDQTFGIRVDTEVTDPQTGVTTAVTEAGAGTYTLNGNQITATVTQAAGSAFAGTETGTVSSSTVYIAGLTFVRR